MKTQFVLFGGSGYIGEHLTRYLDARCYDVVIVDEEPPAADLLCFYQPAQGPILFRSDCKFVHLACPRNGAGWDWHRAERALDAGLKLAEHTTGTKLYVSSLSVFDVPDNEYARYKRMAERIVRPQGWSVVRLGTVLGAIPPCSYRSDLGLHRIARAEEPWVSATIRRNVTTIERAVESIFSLLVNPRRDEVLHVTNGIVYYADIVPPQIPRRHVLSSPEYCAGQGNPALEPQIAELQDVWQKLEDDIQEHRTHGT